MPSSFSPRHRQSDTASFLSEPKKNQKNTNRYSVRVFVCFGFTGLGVYMERKPGRDNRESRSFTRGTDATLLRHSGMVGARGGIDTRRRASCRQWQWRSLQRPSASSASPWTTGAWCCGPWRRGPLVPPTTAHSCQYLVTVCSLPRVDVSEGAFRGVGRGCKNTPNWRINGFPRCVSTYSSVSLPSASLESEFTNSVELITEVPPKMMRELLPARRREWRRESWSSAEQRSVRLDAAGRHGLDTHRPSWRRR